MKKLLLALFLALLPSVALGANCNSNPFTLTNGQTADATQVMANFNNLLNCANNNLAHNAANSDITSLSALSTPLSVPQGGTGAATLTLNSVLLGNSTSTPLQVAPLTAGNLLTSDGTTWTASIASLASIVDATNGGIQYTKAVNVVTSTLSPANLVSKSVPLSTDSLLLMDAANGNAPVRSLISQVQAAISKVAQVQKNVATGVATGTTTIPLDDTIPQNTEGDQYLSQAITPTNASSTLQIDAVLFLSNSGNQDQTVALFQDATANALAATNMFLTAGKSLTVFLRFYEVAGTTSATTFKVRSGGENAGTTTLNGQASARLFGGAAASSLTVTEILP